MAKRILPTLVPLLTLLIISGSELVHADEKPQQPSGDSGSLKLHRRLADEFTNLDPGETGWQSESLSETVAKNMKTVAKWLVHPEELRPEKTKDFVTEDFTGGPLHFEKLEKLNEGHSITISRAAAAAEEATGDAAHHGVDGFETALRSLSGVFSGTADQRAKFKVMHMEIDAGAASTKLLFEMHGRNPESGRTQ
ncbi:MAG: hypothetical protein ACR2RV_13720, partial [Verrucomicrobiales bacterium]